MAEMRRQSAVDEIDVAVAEAIMACGGDMREAIAGLIRAQWADGPGARGDGVGGICAASPVEVTLTARASTMHLLEPCETI